MPSHLISKPKSPLPRRQRAELRQHRHEVRRHRLAVGIGRRVHAVDHPVLRRARLEQRVLPVEPVPVEGDDHLLRLPLLQLVGAGVPQLHGARAVALRDHALEVDVVERVVLDVHRQAVLLRAHRDPVRDRPRDQHAVALEAQVPVQAGRVVLLDDEAPVSLPPPLALAPGWARACGESRAWPGSDRASPSAWLRLGLRLRLRLGLGDFGRACGHGWSMAVVARRRRRVYCWRMRLSSRRARVVAAAFLVFVFTTALRATAASSADAVLTLNTIPVVMIAFEFGWRGGAVTAAIALAWVVVWHAIDLSPLGYFSRGMTYFAAGLIVGSFADRSARRTGGGRAIGATCRAARTRMPPALARLP